MRIKSCQYAYWVLRTRTAYAYAYADWKKATEEEEKEKELKDSELLLPRKYEDKNKCFKRSREMLGLKRNVR